MANQIKKKFIGVDQVDDLKILLRNNQPLRARNAANSADISVLKVNATDVVEFLSFPQKSGTPTINAELVNKLYVDTQDALYIPLTQKGAANGVATLDGAGKIPVAQLPNSVMEFQGNWNATTNSPTLIDGTGNAGDVYRVNVAGTQNLGSGSQTYVIGDWVVYNGTIWEKSHAGADAVLSVNGASGVVVLTTSDIAEGTNLYYTAARFNTAFSAKSTTDLTEGSNLYFTDGRAQTAVVIDSIADADTTHAPSRNAVFDALALKLAISSFTDAAVTSKVLTGLSTASGGAVVATDTILAAFGRLEFRVNLNDAKVSYSAATARTDLIASSIVNGDLTHAPDGNSVFAALALKLNIAAFTDAAVTGKLLTGYVSGAGVVAATDSILQAIQKLNGNIAALPAALTWAKASITLSGTDITNGFVDLAHNASVKTIIAFVDRLAIHETEDYTTSVPGSVTRITFAGSLMVGQPEALTAGDKLFFTYSH